MAPPFLLNLCYNKSMGRPKKLNADDKVLLYMLYGAGWTTGSGVMFTSEHPYQVVPAHEVPYLLEEGRFIRATAQDLKDHYQIGE